MSQEGSEKIKAKFQELSALIKEEASEESQEVKDNIINSLNELKKTIEKKENTANAEPGRTFLGDVKDDLNSIVSSMQVDEFVHDAKDDLNTIIKELEAKALKAQYTLQEKFSDTKIKKNEAVVKTADSLIEAINKIKHELADEEKQD